MKSKPVLHSFSDVTGAAAVDSSSGSECSVVSKTSASQSRWDHFDCAVAQHRLSREVAAGAGALDAVMAGAADCGVF